MTQDEIILTADASGLSYYGMGKDRDRFLHHVETFANLVAAAERANLDPKSFMSWQEGYEVGMVAEREACAKALYETWHSQPGYLPWQDGGNSQKQDEARELVRLAAAAELRQLHESNKYLLAACKGLLAITDCVNLHGPATGDARAAIAKAEGDAA